MAGDNSYLSIIALSVKGLNFLVKGIGWLKKRKKMRLYYILPVGNALDR